MRTNTPLQSRSSFIALPPIEKGDADWRSYKAIQLPNGVQCIFVHDKTSKHTACSVCVGSGASADPRELSGLAHFTEHMCFLGSKAYPGENEFKKYLSSHGGRSNASTSMAQTVYKFEILQEHAERAIDIFANFFISPLFTLSGTEREVNAVDSENSKNMSNDGRRRLQILKTLVDPDHHYSKFSTGNAQTLDMDGDNNLLDDSDQSKSAFIREALLAYHRRHYRPDNFVVVIVGPQDLNTFEEWIVPKFSSIINQWDDDKLEKDMSPAELLVHTASKDAPYDTFEQSNPDPNPVPHNPPFGTKFQDNQWPILLTTLPLQSVRKMYLYFPLPSVKGYNDQSPFHFICHLLGHEGPGSCFALLQDEELVNTLSVGPRLSEADHSLLQVSLSLTEKGERQWEDVIKVIFEYCHLLHDVVNEAKDESKGSNSNGNDSKSSSLDEVTRIWDEIQKLKSLRFHQTLPGPAFGLAPYLASSVRRNGTKRSMSVGTMIHESKDTFPLDAILEFLTKLTPQNCFIERSSQSAWKNLYDKKVEENNESETIFGFQKEKWYGVEYHLDKIDASIYKTWDWIKRTEKNDKLHLPAKNLYIPTDLSLCPDLPEEAKIQPRIEKEIDPPNLVVNEKNFGRLWHRLDDRYCLPKANLKVLLRNPAIQYKWDNDKNTWVFDSETGVHTGLILDAFADALAQTTYDAYIAGLNWSLKKSPSGLVLQCSGYSQHLTDFAIEIFKQFYSEEASFLNQKHVRTNKDKSIRYLESYLKSKRADNYASYYTTLLLSSRGLGVEDSLHITKKVNDGALRTHHQRLISLSSTKVECLVSGNVSQCKAERFFQEIQKVVNSCKTNCKYDDNRTNPEFHTWLPGPFERGLNEGDDIHLHFQSQNPEEQNGAVKIIFQSNTPGYRGVKDDEFEELKQTAALRVLAQILKEPFFNQLRTKEQLGYVVKSHYDISFSLDKSVEGSRATLPINSVVLNILSRKLPPPIISRRIDEFLEAFREKLSSMTDIEIKDHTDSLSTKLLKPIQNLGIEVDDHFNKIRRYSPELVDDPIDTDTTIHNDPVVLPWDGKRKLALAINALNRQDLLHTWDSVIAGKRRSRIVTHIYGSSFPMENSCKRIPFGLEHTNLNSTTDIVKVRNKLSPFGSRFTNQDIGVRTLLRNKTVAFAGVAIGFGFLYYTLNCTRDDSKKLDAFRAKK